MSLYLIRPRILDLGQESKQMIMNLQVLLFELGPVVLPRFFLHFRVVLDLLILENQVAIHEPYPIFIVYQDVPIQVLNYVMVLVSDVLQIQNLTLQIRRLVNLIIRCSPSISQSTLSGQA